MVKYSITWFEFGLILFAAALPAWQAGRSQRGCGPQPGHARRGVTARHYIRRPDSALIAAADRVAKRIAAALAGRKSSAGAAMESNE